MSYRDINYVQTDYQLGGASITTNETAADAVPCLHRNGWFVTVRFWKFFRKLVFVCSDCGEVAEGPK